MISRQICLSSYFLLSIVKLNMLFKEFYKIVQSEETTVQFLIEKGVFQTDNCPICLNSCGQTRLRLKKSRAIFRCSNSSCRSKQSVRKVNKFFTFNDALRRCSSRLSIASILEIVFHWINERPLCLTAETTDIQPKLSAIGSISVEKLLSYNSIKDRRWEDFLASFR